MEDVLPSTTNVLLEVVKAVQHSEKVESEHKIAIASRFNNFLHHNLIHDYFILFLVCMRTAVNVFFILVNVFSRDGATGCGVFCAVYNAIQQLQQDEEVDMFTIVRQLQSRRPEMISNLVHRPCNSFYRIQELSKIRISKRKHLGLHS